MIINIEVAKEIRQIQIDICSKCQKKLFITKDCQKCLRIIDGKIHTTQFSEGFWA